VRVEETFFVAGRGRVLAVTLAGAVMPVVGSTCVVFGDREWPPSGRGVVRDWTAAP